MKLDDMHADFNAQAYSAMTPASEACMEKLAILYLEKYKGVCTDDQFTTHAVRAIAASHILQATFLLRGIGVTNNQIASLLIGRAKKVLELQ